MTDDVKIWTPLPLVKTTAEYFAGKGIEGSKLDAEVLLCAALGVEKRIDLYAGFDRPLTDDELASYRGMVRRRAAREPVSHILGYREFMGIRFKVNRDVLTPRPETEMIVEEVVRLIAPPRKKRSEEYQDRLLEEMKKQGVLENQDVVSGQEDYEGRGTFSDDMVADEGKGVGSEMDVANTVEMKSKHTVCNRIYKILDLGTGSGCIAISIAAMCPNVEVVAVDISPEALAVARDNAESAGVGDRVDFREGDFFAACREGESFDFILSNPPYISDEDTEIWPEVRDFEPKIALFAGKDGLNCQRSIANQAETWLNPGGRILLEVGAGQAHDVMELIRAGSLLDEIRAIRDYSGIDRVVTAKRPEI